MALQLIDVEDLEAVRGQHLAAGEEREVREVLVVDRVELIALHEPQQVRDLDGHDPAGRQQGLHAAHEVVQVRHVGHHVVRHQQVGAPSLRRQPAGQVATEELHHGLDSALARRLRDVGGGLDSERRDAAVADVLEQVPVVARQLDHGAAGVEAESLHGHVHVAARVLDPGVRVRREVRVLLEDVRRGHELLELHEEAALTDLRVERVERLLRGEALGGHIALAERRHAEVHERVPQRAGAEAARGLAVGIGYGSRGLLQLCRH